MAAFICLCYAAVADRDETFSGSTAAANEIISASLPAVCTVDQIQVCRIKYMHLSAKRYNGGRPRSCATKFDRVWLFPPRNQFLESSASRQSQLVDAFPTSRTSSWLVQCFTMACRGLQVMILSRNPRVYRWNWVDAAGSDGWTWVTPSRNAMLILSIRLEDPKSI